MPRKRPKSKLYDQIEAVLREYPGARDCDVHLTLMIWWTFYSTRLIKVEGNIPAVKLSEIKKLPREDHVKRYRARIQNEENRYLPTKWEVAKKRRIARKQWEEALGYTSKI